MSLIHTGFDKGSVIMPTMSVCQQHPKGTLFCLAAFVFFTFNAISKVNNLNH
jgi:hypothetical protein